VLSEEGESEPEWHVVCCGGGTDIPEGYRGATMKTSTLLRHLLSVAIGISALAGGATITVAQQAQTPTPSAPPASPAAQAPVPLVPASTPEQEKLRVVPAKQQGKVHILPATLQTTTWGWFNNAQPPVLHVDSGDTIVFETMMHSHNQIVPGTTIEQIKKLRTDFPGRGPHTLTGPVYIEGAEPGMVLKVKINKIVPRAYAMNFNVPGMFGQFPDRFPEGQVKYFYLDLDRKVAEFAPGIEIPIRPFPGTTAVARAEPGQYSTVPPGRYAGNIDVRDFTEGTALYVPIFVKGALLWTGDSHAAQGNGEINLTALETAYKEMNVTVEVIKDMKLEWPRIETPDAWITLGIDKDLNVALDLLKAETTKFLMEQRKLDKDQAEKLMLTNWDCRVTQVVDVNKGIHCFSAKDTRSRRSIEPLPGRENKTYLVTVAKDADLNKAMDTASWEMVELLQKQKGLTRLDAYSLASMVMDCRPAAPTGAEKTVHCLLPKSTWVASR
jgi:acetamidase/formamidase